MILPVIVLQIELRYRVARDCRNETTYLLLMNILKISKRSNLNVNGIILTLITFYEFGDVKDLADVKYHFEDTVVWNTIIGTNNTLFYYLHLHLYPHFVFVYVSAYVSAYMYLHMYLHICICICICICIFYNVCISICIVCILFLLFFVLDCICIQLYPYL